MRGLRPLVAGWDGAAQRFDWLAQRLGEVVARLLQLQRAGMPGQVEKLQGLWHHHRHPALPG